jgi:hypothetical protein
MELKDKDLAQHIEEWSSYKELLEDYIKNGTNKETLEWAKQRLKSVDNLLTMNGEVK